MEMLGREVRQSVQEETKLRISRGFFAAVTKFIPSDLN